MTWSLDVLSPLSPGEPRKTLARWESGWRGRLSPKLKPTVLVSRLLLLFVCWDSPQMLALLTHTHCHIWPDRCFVSFISGAGDRSQGLAHVRQVLPTEVAPPPPCHCRVLETGHCCSLTSIKLVTLASESLVWESQVCKPHSTLNFLHYQYFPCRLIHGLKEI